VTNKNRTSEVPLKVFADFWDTSWFFDNVFFWQKSESNEKTGRDKSRA
jgi:hypothetical protein